MFKASYILIVLVGALLSGLEAAKEQEVFLPPDCEVVKIVGNGFKLELSKFDDIKNQFKEVEEESSKVESPRGNDESGAGGNASDNGQGEVPDDQAITNEDLFEETKNRTNEVQNYGPVDKSLMSWISDRAGFLLNRVQRYDNELRGAKERERIVLDILLLNTVVDIDNLIKEGLLNLGWVQRKRSKLFTKNINEGALLKEVETFVINLIKKNKDIERKLKGTNDPGEPWATNTHAMKRVLHEQRFSKSIGNTIVEYLSSHYGMMKRSIIYQNTLSKGYKLDDGLYYAKARGTVLAGFPFSAQDAISHAD